LSEQSDMQNQKDRIIIDTNLWLSFLLSKDQSKIDLFFKKKLLILLFSDELINEFTEVAQRPKFKKYFATKDLLELIEQMRNHSEFISVKSMVTVCRDDKDNFLLSLAKDGNAAFLITGDKDLLELKQFGKTKIVSMTEYLQKK
jgi:putative PIN family toxin of toxin-antitoxin system